MAIQSTALSSRYEIRPLEMSHCEWALAIVCHSNAFYSPLWASVYKDRRGELLVEMFKKASYLMSHQIESGKSLGIFDKEYQYKRPESAATGGKLYWDFDGEVADADTLLEQMDFPLVTVAMAYDSANPLDLSKLTDMFAVMPLFPVLMGALDQADPRDKASWEAKKPGEVLFRAATSSRSDYEGKGLMKALAHEMMRRSAEQGFRGIQIECAHPAVTHVWSHPPAPFKGEIVASLDAHSYEMENEKGEKIHPFRPADLALTKVYVTLG